MILLLLGALRRGFFPKFYSAIAAHDSLSLSLSLLPPPLGRHLTMHSLQFEPAIMEVFGKTLLCESLESASGYR